MVAFGTNFLVIDLLIFFAVVDCAISTGLAVIFDHLSHLTGGAFSGGTRRTVYKASTNDRQASCVSCDGRTFPNEIAFAF